MAKMGTSWAPAAPALFVGHGSPMHAIEKDEFSKRLFEFAQSVEKPKALLVISAHWVEKGFHAAGHSDELLYDMYGFPRELYEVRYPAANADFLLAKLQELGFKQCQRDMDHGVWSVLVHMFPNADIPVVQIALNKSLTLFEHYETARKLRMLRESGIMIVASGNVTHNLNQLHFNEKEGSILHWAQSFDAFIANAVSVHNIEALFHFQSMHYSAPLAHPTIEHYLPILYAQGAAYEEEKANFLYEGIWYGSLSMRSWYFS
jgi:4,5-DOPA dioxygenase extradiol